MDPNHRKQALRMIPYGLYVLSAKSAEGRPDDETLALRDLGEKTFYGG